MSSEVEDDSEDVTSSKGPEALAIFGSDKATSNPFESKFKIEKTKKNNKNWYICPECPYETRHFTKMKNHVDSKHRGVKYQCSHCEKIFNTDSTLRGHRIAKHGPPKPMVHCEYCEYSSTEKMLVKSHTKSVHLDIKFQCELCDKRFTTKDGLRRHIKSFHQQMRELCDICKKYSKCVKIHKVIQHKERQCPECGETLLNKSALNLHLKNVHNVCKEKKVKKTYKCPSCDYVGSKGNLKIHDMTHHNITYIYCDQCDFKTKTKQSFNHHIKQNHDSSSKKHKCKYCDYESVRRDNVEEHQQSVHENVRYPCDQCGHQATRLQYLEKHMKTFHSG